MHVLKRYKDKCAQIIIEHFSISKEETRELTFCSCITMIRIGYEMSIILEGEMDSEIKVFILDAQGKG